MGERNTQINQTVIAAITASLTGINPLPIVTDDLHSAGDEAASYLLDLYAKTLVIAAGSIQTIAHLEGVPATAILQQLASIERSSE